MNLPKRRNVIYTSTAVGKLVYMYISGIASKHLSDTNHAIKHTYRHHDIDAWIS